MVEDVPRVIVAGLALKLAVRGLGPVPTVKE